MKSFAFQDLPRKKIKKLASQFSDDEIAASIESDPDFIPFILELPGVDPQLMHWSAFNGPMTTLDEDSVRSYAQVQYLIRIKAPYFHSFEEVESFADLHRWPRKQKNDQIQA